MKGARVIAPEYDLNSIVDGIGGTSKSHRPLPRVRTAKDVLAPQEYALQLLVPSAASSQDSRLLDPNATASVSEYSTPVSLFNANTLHIGS